MTAYNPTKVTLKTWKLCKSSNNKESAESRWKPGQWRGDRGGRGIYSSRYVSNDRNVRNSLVDKVNNTNQPSEKSSGLSLSSASQEPKKNEPTANTSPVPVTSNGPSAIVAKVNKADIIKSGGPTPHEPLDIVKKKTCWETSGMGKPHKQFTSGSSDSSAAETQVISPGAHFSASDPVLVPSQDSRIPGAAGTIKREVGSQRNAAEQVSVFPSEGQANADSKVSNSSMEGNIVESKPVGVVKDQLSDATLRPSSSHGGSVVVRPSSNHSSRSQHVVGLPKVSLAKEWKPKSTNPNLAPGSSMNDGQSENSAAIEVNTKSRPVTGDLDPKEALSNLHTNVFDNPQVILPNHLHVPGVSFCFGSFDAISLDTSPRNAPDDSNPAPSLETCQSVEETAEQTSSLENVLPTAEEEVNHDHPQQPEVVAEKLLSVEHEVPSTGTQEYVESKPESDLLQRSYQYPVIHSSPSYSFGMMPTMLGSQLPPFEGSESQAREVSRGPSFVVPQPFDPASYYAQFYRSAADSDGRISPFHASSVASKYNGSVAVLPPHTSQSVSEGGNSLVMSTGGPNAFVTQPAGGVMPSSIAVTQQPVPVFRQPIGIPFPHYPPNYMPYGPYFSPFFVPTFNQSLGSSAYPQQPQAGNIYAAPPGPPPKFSASQYKAGTSSENSTSVGVASSYRPYGASASTTGSSAAAEDLTAQQFKESNVYIAGQQQSEGSTVWLAPPGRDMSSLQATSFYNIPSQGQVAFPQPHPGHGPFTGIYHTAQAVSASHPHLQQSQTMASAVDIVGPTPNVYQQQPQHAQVTWANNNY